jgi:hypothetical protein
VLTLLAHRRRRRRDGSESGNLVFGTIGWLFADLMFALAMAFLVATTVGQPPKPLSATASPSLSPSRSKTPKPNPSREPVLELRPVELQVTVDWSGLLSNQAAAKNALANAIRRDPRLKGRHAGLVLSFGGADGGEGRAIAIANKADEVMRSLGTKGYVFRGTVYRPFLSLHASPATLKLDIYLFKT